MDEPEGWKGPADGSTKADPKVEWEGERGNSTAEPTEHLINAKGSAWRVGDTIDFVNGKLDLIRYGVSGPGGNRPPNSTYRRAPISKIWTPCMTK